MTGEARALLIRQRAKSTCQLQSASGHFFLLFGVGLCKHFRVSCVWERTQVLSRHSPLRVFLPLLDYLFVSLYGFKKITKYYLVFVTKFKEVYKVTPYHLLSLWPHFLAPAPFPLLGMMAINCWCGVNVQTIVCLCLAKPVYRYTDFILQKRDNRKPIVLQLAFCTVDIPQVKHTDYLIIF